VDEDAWEDIVGTVTGYSSVLVLTETGFFQKLVHERLKWYLRDGEAGEQAEEPEDDAP
jgi:arginine repressor